MKPPLVSMSQDISRNMMNKLHYIFYSIFVSEFINIYFQQVWCFVANGTEWMGQQLSFDANCGKNQYFSEPLLILFESHNIFY